jgi:hypothetical protein
MLFYATLLAILLACISADTPLDFGDASSYAIFAGTAITASGTSVVNGDAGVYPGAVITITAPATFNGVLDPANAAALNAKAALTVAYNTLVAKAADFTIAGDLIGLTLVPGVYKSAAALALTGVLTLDAAGDPDAVWTFQIGAAIGFAANSKVVFLNGVGNPDYVYWQVTAAAAIAAGSEIIGNVIANAAITGAAGATVKGRLLSRGAAVTIVGSDVTIPS